MILRSPVSHTELLSKLFRHEYGRMTAVLCRHFGITHMETAEDIVSDTFLKASEYWAANGIPHNPEGWLYAVAKNKAKDHFKHQSIVDEYAKNTESGERYSEPEIDFSTEAISDSELAMIFAVSDPMNPVEAQISLALKILCGFTVEEIANALLEKPETIKKRLQRARDNLRTHNFQIRPLSRQDIESRFETVLKTLYLLFNEGYFSKTNNRMVRKELCLEAMRLAMILTENPLTNSSLTHALLALMCYQSSRLDARINEEGEVVLFDQQDRKRWDHSLIEKGNYFLIMATDGNEVSKYHLEAGIAYWHTTGSDNKWHHILQLYNQLLIIEYSPMAALNRTFAYAQVHGHEKAIAEAEKLNLPDSSYYHGLMGYLYSKSDIRKAVLHYENAMNLTKSPAEKETLRKEIERMKTALPEG